MRRAGLVLLLVSAGCNLIGLSKVDAGPPPAAAPATPPPPAAPPAPVDPLASAGVERVLATVHGPLEESLRRVAPPDVQAPLSQVTARLLVWWVSVQRELRPNDEIEVLFERLPGREPLVRALRFVSGKTGKEHRAYLFKPAQSPFARYFEASGEELEERLESSPIDEYEQVTSLLRDGRRHKGVDFKAPAGTPVKMPFDGSLTRKNWSWRANGNCLEFHDNAGRRIVFLHLSEIPKTLAVGRRFKAGEVVAQSGNTGHTTAPHLHYQLEDPSGKLLDPFRIHKTFHRPLSESDREAFRATMAKYDALFTGKALAAPGAPPPVAAPAVAPAVAASAPAEAAAAPPPAPESPPASATGPLPSP